MLFFLLLSLFLFFLKLLGLLQNVTEVITEHQK